MSVPAVSQTDMDKAIKVNVVALCPRMIRDVSVIQSREKHMIKFPYKSEFFWSYV